MRLIRASDVNQEEIITNPIALHMLSCSGIRFPCLIALTPLLNINIIAMIKLRKMSLPNPDGLSLEEVILIFLFVSCCRVRSESCAASGSKACREKLRRDRLNDKYTFYSKFQLSPVF